jgi:hypothetical protein
MSRQFSIHSGAWESNTIPLTLSYRLSPENPVGNKTKTKKEKRKGKIKVFGEIAGDLLFLLRGN